LALVGAALTVPPMVGSAQALDTGTTFNWPRPWGTGVQRYRIVRHVEGAIDRTRPTAADPHPVILISSYLLDRSQSVDALIGACRREVSVRVILDEDIDNRNSKRLIGALNADNVAPADGDALPPEPRSGPCGRPLPGERSATHTKPLTDAQARASVALPTDAAATWGTDESYVKKCDGSCRGAGGNMHSKFFAFTSTGHVEDVVMVSSSNLNQGGAILGWNDLYTMVDRPVSYAAYLKIHRDMTEDTRAGDGKEEVVDGPFTSRFYPMYKASRRNDPELESLQRIRCRGAFGRTQVHVAMFGWRGVRGRYMADKLFSLSRQGCSVRIIFGAPSKKMASYLRTGARRVNVDLYNSRWDFNDDGVKEIRSHNKYVLVKGSYAGDRSSHLVMTGSANWVDGGLDRGDEVTLAIRSRDAHREYLTQWHLVRRHSVRVAR